MSRSWVAVACLLAMTLALVACGTGEYSPLATSSPATARACASSTCQPGNGAQNVSVFIEPDARATPILHAIEHATTSVWVESYLLTDTEVIQALESAANRGVDVRVLLELSPYGEGSVSPQLTIERLQAAGVKAEGANPRFRYTHAKTLVVDRTTAFIMTCNLTLSGLGGSRSATNRDYGIIDTDPADVKEAEAVFQADWARTTPEQPDPNLVVSPVDARSKLTTLLASAHSQVLLEDEELVDQQIDVQLEAAAKRGVDVQVVLPAPSGTSANAELAPLLAAGVHIRYSSRLYMHAKMIVEDSSRGFVGSENFSADSLDDNREVGVLLSNHDVLVTLTDTFDMDWSVSSPV
jgi:cardiolipin synthase A/B